LTFAQLFEAASGCNSSIDGNTTLVIHRDGRTRRRRRRLLAQQLDGLAQAGARRGQAFKLHVVAGSEGAVLAALFTTEVVVRRASGDVREPQAETLPATELGREWE
jgi:glutamate-5-semialdehyde dehydrogenase